MLYSSFHVSPVQLPNHDSPFQLCLTPHLPFQIYPLPCRLVHYPLQQDTYFESRCCDFLHQNVWSIIFLFLSNNTITHFNFIKKQNSYWFSFFLLGRFQDFFVPVTLEDFDTFQTEFWPSLPLSFSAIIMCGLYATMNITILFPLWYYLKPSVSLL